MLKGRKINNSTKPQKIICPTCDGSGNDLEDLQDSLRICKDCKGAGFLEATVVPKGGTT